MLGRQRRKADVPILTNALSDPMPWVRAYAARALRMIGDKEAIRPLEELKRREQDKEVLAYVDGALEALRSL
jgi:HEAT repeat protein